MALTLSQLSQQTRRIAIEDASDKPPGSIHAENDNAVSFYKHLVPGIDQSPTDPLHLVVLTKDIKKSLNL